MNKLKDQFSERNGSQYILCEKNAQTLRHEQSVDYIIPDYLPDISTVLKFSLRPKIEGKMVTSSGTDLEGTVSISLLLLTENNTLASLEYSEPFDMSLGADFGGGNCMIIAEPSVDHSSTRLLNPRKMNIRYQINTSVKALCPQYVSPLCIGADTLDDDMRIQRLTDTHLSAEWIALEEGAIPVSKDIELDSSYPQALEIIFSSIDLRPCEVFASDNGAEIKTEAFFCCIYKNANGGYTVFDKKFVLENSVAFENPQQINWVVKATPGKVEVSIAPNGYGEMRMLEIDFSYDLELIGVTNHTVATVSDAYSTSYVCDNVFNEIENTVFKRSFGSGISVNTGAAKNDVGSDNISGIFTGAVGIKDYTCKYSKEKNKLVVEGNAEVSLITLVGKDEAGVDLFGAGSYSYPFKCELDCSEDLSQCCFDCSLYPSDARFRVDAQKVYADFELYTGINAYEKEKIIYLSELKLDKSKEHKRFSSPMVLCYPTAQESLWDIASHYKISTERIMEANGMKDECLGASRVLIIPRS